VFPEGREAEAMRIPRVRFKVRTTMVAVGFAATLMAGVRMAIRPYPEMVFSSGAHYVIWSNDTGTVVEHGPHDLVVREFRFVTLVRWPDGALSVYVHS
jgi:hypothetical protein